MYSDQFEIYILKKNASFEACNREWNEDLIKESKKNWQFS